MSGRRTVWSSIAVVALAGLAVGLYWFQPWKLVVDERVDETLPTVAVAAPATDPTTAPSTTAPSTTAPSTTAPATTAPTATLDAATPSPTRRGNRLLASGSLISHEHDTRGSVRVVELADGSRVLTLQDLDTSNGPDVEVWLTDAPVLTGEKGWYVFDDGRHVSLGDLKGNQGNQVYRIPRDVDLSTYTSVSLWCARFDVSFGAAPLRA